MYSKSLDDVVKQFNTTPFLFIGSGITRRYYNLPDWKSLLEIFAIRISNDPYAYSSYESSAKAMNCEVGLYPQIAELIEHDYNKLWFSNPEIRNLDVYYSDMVKSGVSPFKAEIAMYIKHNSNIVEYHKSEIKKLHEISKKSISGVITTNYDLFLEDTLDEFHEYVGQEELIFSAIQGIAEIYKIHGSINNPNSIIINKIDYTLFDEKSPYLAAKLMTIFMEYPIVFLGYSLNDSNIQKIIYSIVNCLSKENLEKLQERFVFVEYDEHFKDVEISPHSMVIGDKILYMTKIRCSDFSLIYDAISKKKSEIPVKLLRKFKQELYTYTLSNSPTTNIKVASIDDKRLDDDELVLAIGRMSEFGLKGLSGLSGSEWYRNVILNDLDFNPDELLKYAFPKLRKQNSNNLPFFKFLYYAREKHLDVLELAEQTTFDKIISDSIRNHRNILGSYTSVNDIWEKEKNLNKATYLIAHLTQEQICVDDLEKILNKIFSNNRDILETETQNTKTNIRRLIRIYDCLKYRNVEKSLD
ncbi:MAG: hypothetical protein K0R23_172 [Lacrimispora sp.]|jgi:hypothetical protein|nr:hypothetical protein [Lacrimispora sp.]